MKISLVDARAWVAAELQRAGASEAMAASTAAALVLAEAQGLGSHGLSRVAQYAGHLRHGRVDGRAEAAVVRRRGGALLVDAREGLAFPACELALREGIAAAPVQGVVFIGVTRSHHAGVLVDHLRAAAAAGLVGLGFANAPAAMPAAGGRHPIFGTNPVAAAFPRRPIPLGWALDANGEPTTDPRSGMDGSMLPIGAASSPKGAMLALVVELLVTALIGANFGFEASSFFVDEGNRPRIGQAFLLIDPGALAGSAGYLDRIELLITEMLRDEGVRLPGARREVLRRRAEVEGIEVPDALLAQWRAAGST
jgi:(2R)-3-sulfolactate dehydrogenase (NADP+)